MEMIKLTSVEWLRDKIFEEFRFSFSDNIFEQAKEMHKQEIIDAYYQCGKDNFEHIKVINRSATEYYNETFNHIVDTNEMIDVPQQNDVNVGYGDRIYYPNNDVREDDVDKWNSADNPPNNSRSILIMTEQGIAEGSYSNGKYLQFRWSCYPNVTYWRELPKF